MENSAKFFCKTDGKFSFCSFVASLQLGFTFDEESLGTVTSAEIVSMSMEQYIGEWLDILSGW